MTLTRGFSNKKARPADETQPREERKDEKKLAFILEALASKDPFQNKVCVCCGLHHPADSTNRAC